MQSNKSLDKRFTLFEKERHFKKACDQIVLLNHKILDLQKRYKIFKQDNTRSFRYTMRLRLAVVEGVRNMYYDYAYSTADQVVELRSELFGEIVDIVTEPDTDYMSQ